MKIKLLVCTVLLALAGCAGPSVTNGTAPTAPALGSFVQAFGPPVAQILNERLSLQMLGKNPQREAELHLIAVDMRLAVQALGTDEISEAVIKNFAHAEAVKYSLLPGEENLVVQALLLARTQFLVSTGASVVLISDPRVAPWIDAITQGIEDGITEYHRRASAK